MHSGRSDKLTDLSPAASGCEVAWEHPKRHCECCPCREVSENAAGGGPAYAGVREDQLRKGSIAL
jgi:hypothetical protein